MSYKQCFGVMVLCAASCGVYAGEHKPSLAKSLLLHIKTLGDSLEKRAGHEAGCLEQCRKNLRRKCFDPDISFPTMMGDDDCRKCLKKRRREQK